jgi:hypothetical protein
MTSFNLLRVAEICAGILCARAILFVVARIKAYALGDS